MVSAPNKRKASSTTGPEAKRKKVVANKAKAKNRSSGRAVLDASALEWETVGEEDFGGLQVLSGVDVVRDGRGVRFVVRDKDDNGKSNGRDQDEPFQGFSDDALEGAHVDSGQAGRRQGVVEGKKRHQETAGADGKDEGTETSKALDAMPRPIEKSKKRSKNSDPASQKPQNAPANEFMALAEIEDDDNGDEDDMGEWMALNLSPRLVSAIAKLGFKKPTAIQQMSIPEILAGDDVIGKAQTGSGKTLAFAIPILERWLEDKERLVVPAGDPAGEQGERPREQKIPTALVLSPTRELAKQIGDHIKALCHGLASSSPYVCVVTGGLSIQKQQRQLEKADVVIGTPGRLWELLEGDAALQEQFTKIKFLVIDEADRLFKAGQFKEAEDIIGALDRRNPEEAEDGSDSGDSDADDARERQTLVFSATFDKDLQTKLAGKSRSSKSLGGGPDSEKMAYLIKCLKFRAEPKFIDANPASQMAANLREGLIECGAMEKDLYLYTVLLLNPGRRTLVFTNSISAVRRITPLLQNLNQNAIPLHSQMIQKARLRSLEKFAAARSSILVATDVAARGLDIEQVEQVIHYHVPRAADTYIHRSGRTARADRSGVSIILCSPDEVVPTRRLGAKVHADRASAGSKTQQAHNQHHLIETLPIDRKIASRLKPRVDLAKKMTDAVLAKEKAHSDDQWLRNAASELGVDYDSGEFEATAAAGWGAGASRGGGRRRKEKEARALTKAEMAALKAQLRHELSQRVNLGVSERYIAGGRVDMAQLLRERESCSVAGIFLGGGDNLGLGL